MTRKVIKAKLKSIGHLISQNLIEHQGYNEYRGVRNNWFINDKMALRFGDGRIYEFEEKSRDQDYTHKGVIDGWSYSEEWFIVQPDIEKKEKEVSPPVLFDPEEIL